jgi:hypothetical protein
MTRENIIKTIRASVAKYLGRETKLSELFINALGLAIANDAADGLEFLLDEERSTRKAEILAKVQEATMWQATGGCIDPELPPPDPEYVAKVIKDIRVHDLNGGSFTLPMSSTVDSAQAREAAEMVGCDFGESLLPACPGCAELERQGLDGLCIDCAGRNAGSW